MDDIIEVTIGATFNPRKKSKEQIRGFITNQIKKLEGVSLDNCNINGKNLVEIIISIPQSVFASQGPSDIGEIEEFISFFAPMFLEEEKMPVEIKTIEVKLGS